MKTLYLYFGDINSGVFPESIKNKTVATPSVPDVPLILQHQVHGKSGRAVDNSHASSPALVVEGDYQITNKTGFSIGVLTADCLPIIYVDRHNKAIGIAHAGWKGSDLAISTQVIKHMQQKYNTHIPHLEIYFGPSAQPCCYQVNEEFIRQLSNQEFTQITTQHRNNSLYFDLPEYNRQILQTIGVHPRQINGDHNLCTICNINFCSYRREPNSAIRQISAIGLY